LQPQHQAGGCDVGERDQGGGKKLQALPLRSAEFPVEFGDAGGGLG
jgi:hypothetical protein